MIDPKQIHAYNPFKNSQKSRNQRPSTNSYNKSKLSGKLPNLKLQG